MSDKETYSTDGMVCPHCGHCNNPEESHHYDEDTHEHWCDVCDEAFETSCFVSYSWTSNVISGDDDE
jgi:hypothetical protein